MKTKKYWILFALVVILLLFVSPTIVRATMRVPIPAADPAKEQAKAPENSPVLEDDWSLTPPGLNRIVFIHYKKGFGREKPCNNDGVCDPGEGGWCGDCRSGEEEPETKCYDFLQKSKPRWQWTEDYHFVEGAGLGREFVGGVLVSSTEEWDRQVSFEVFGSGNYGYYPWGKYDLYNAISFGDYPEGGVIAVTAIWFQGKNIYEYDIMFDTDFVWGDVTVDSEVMDLQNIATHELGHGAGLGDLYDSVCSEMTMYGYSDYGETKKQTLEAGDIAGVKKLYQ